MAQAAIAVWVSSLAQELPHAMCVAKKKVARVGILVLVADFRRLLYFHC